MKSLSRVVPRLSAVLLTALGLLVVAGSLSPAHADVPVGWSTEPGESVNLLKALLLLGGIPLVLALLIIAAVYAPSLARGERLLPGEPHVSDQWLGGPRRGTAELAGPDSDTSNAGGARGSW